jgi:hypothetical protein
MLLLDGVIVFDCINLPKNFLVVVVIPILRTTSGVISNSSLLLLRSSLVSLRCLFEMTL